MEGKQQPIDDQSEVMIPNVLAATVVVLVMMMMMMIGGGVVTHLSPYHSYSVSRRKI